MTMTNQDARIKRGGSYLVRVSATDENGDPLDLSGVDLVYKIARRKSSSPVVTVENISVEQDAGEGEVEDLAIVPLTTSVTSELKNFRYYHELFFIDVNGEKSVLMTGSLQVVDSLAAEYEQET